MTRAAIDRLHALSLRVPVRVGATHVYLTAAAIETLFCDHYHLHERSRLGQPRMYEADETVTLIGPRGHVGHVPVIGPPRPENQVQVSSTDALVLGIAPPVRKPGDLEGTPGILIKGPRASLRLESGVIRTLRHVHMTPADSEYVGVRDGDTLQALIRTRASPVILRDVLVRVGRDSRRELHLDLDEANALGLCSGDEVEVRKGGTAAVAI